MALFWAMAPGHAARDAQDGRWRVSGVVPTCLAMVMCRGVLRDERTCEPVIDRALYFIEASSFPMRTDRFTVWMQFRNGNGMTTMELTVEHVPSARLEPEIVAAARFTLRFKDPNEVVEHASVFENGLHFEQPGRYRLRLAAGGAAMVQRDFSVFRSREVRG